MGRLWKNGRQKSVHGRGSNSFGRFGPGQHCDRLVQVVWNVFIGERAQRWKNWTKNGRERVTKQPGLSES